MLNEKFPEQDFNNNWLYRDLLQHDDEVRSLGIDYGKTKSNGIRNIYTVMILKRTAVAVKDCVLKVLSLPSLNVLKTSQIR